MKKRDYVTDVKLKLLDMGYKIVSKDEEYKNMTTNLKFRCHYCGEEYNRTPKMALRSNCGCVRCIQKNVTGYKLHELKFNVDAFILKYQDELLDLKYVKKSSFSYKCVKCGCRIIRKADRIETTTHKELCKKCGQGVSGENKRLTTEDKNDYLKSIGSKTICIEKDETKNNKYKIKFKCSCGTIFHRKWNVVRTYGFDRCNRCSSKQSYGEVEIENILIKNKVNYEREKRFEDCRNKHMLPFDFYLPGFNTIIEFDGLHHYKDVRGDGSHKKTVINDRIKNKFCIDKGIKLIRIPYYKRDNLEKIILDNLYGNTEPS